MKIEEVLQQLNDIKGFVPRLVDEALQDIECMEKDIEAIDMAIKALERVEQLERFCKGQSSIIDKLEKDNAELSERVVKAEKLMS